MVKTRRGRNVTRVHTNAYTRLDLTASTQRGAHRSQTDLFRGTMEMTTQESAKDLGCSSSEEETKSSSSPPGAPRHRHPFSVEAIMSGRTTWASRVGEPGRCEMEAGSPPAGFSSVYKCGDAATQARKSSPAAPMSPVKSEASEAEDWLLSSQPREFYTFFIAPHFP